MNRKFLILVATVCGLVMAVSLLLLPMVTAGKGDNSVAFHAIEGGREFSVGNFLLVFVWFAAAFTALPFFKKTDLLGLSEARHLAIAFLAFKLTMFFLIALLIEGTGEHASFGVGYWFTFIAGLIGTLAVFLTFNPALAQKIADAAKAKDEDGAPAASEDATSDDA